MILDYYEFNHVLLLLTAVVTILAGSMLVFLYCKFRCGCCRRRTVVLNQPRHHSVTEYHRKPTTRPHLDHEFDFIDDRQTNVISSSVRVTSLHNL